MKTAALSSLLVALLALAAGAYHRGAWQLPPALEPHGRALCSAVSTHWAQLHGALASATQPQPPRSTSGSPASSSSSVAGPPSHSAGLAPVQLAASLDAGACHIAGKVDELSDCTYASVHALNAGHVHPVVAQLVKTAFFRYFKVNIFCDCPLWPDDSMCSLRACSVCECEAGEVPAPWLAAEQASARACKAAASPDCSTQDCAIEMESSVNQAIEPSIKQQLVKHSKGWRGINNPWIAEGEEEEEFQYVNLLANPERYTGYKGEHAHRIWAAIYNQSCFTDGLSCSEERVFFRLLSGMHASISAHLAADYLLDEQQGIWGPNLAEFKARLGTPETRYRVQNLYFAYLFVLRAVMKAAPVLASYEYDTGMPAEDARARELLQSLLTDPAISESCPMPFDEGRLWKGDGAAELKKQLQETFQNITRVMDCVGCEKCKLWGKLQTLGIATALKILFSARDCSGEPSVEQPFGEQLELERNEVIALINLLGRFSTSLQTWHTLTQQLARQEGLAPAVDEGAMLI